MLRFRTVTVMSLLGLGLALACSSDEDSGVGGGAATGSGADGNDLGSGANGSGTAANGSGAANGSENGAAADGAGATTGSGTGAAADGSGTTTGDGSGTLDGGAAAPGSDWDVNQVTDACAEISLGAEGSPAMLQFVIDKSTSMNETAPSTNGGSKWDRTVEALVASFPEMDRSLAVGEYFYPNVSVQGRDPIGCADQSGGVAIAPLDDAQVAALQAGVEAVPNPTNPPGTPTHDAWREGLRRIQEALAAPPAGFENARGYIVLVTDGMPTHTLDCGDAYGMGDPGGELAVDAAQWQELIDDVANTSAATGVQTFVVGVPGSENDNQVPTINGQKDYVPRGKLSELAIAGQTPLDGCSSEGPNYCHLDMVEEPDFVAGLRAVIGQIVSSIVSCEYRVPELPPEQNIFVNPDEVNVLYFPAGGDTPVTLARSFDSCATGEWQYDSTQTNILLCDSACTTVRNDADARIEVDFGCVGVL